jgi:hypothetical protein
MSGAVLTDSLFFFSICSFLLAAGMATIGTSGSTSAAFRVGSILRLRQPMNKWRARVDTFLYPPPEDMTWMMWDPHWDFTAAARYSIALSLSLSLVEAASLSPQVLRAWGACSSLLTHLPEKGCCFSPVAFSSGGLSLLP